MLLSDCDFVGQGGADATHAVVLVLTAEEEEVVGLLEAVYKDPEGGQWQVLKFKPPQGLHAVGRKGGKCPLGGVSGVFLEILHDGVIDPGLDLWASLVDRASSEKVSPFSSSNHRVR